ncbi:NAD(P)-dependent dehydrogenase (short-subunit alcohol dehydrogenase family) [Inhella inkyongensis]|uniref:NAD(P)-dependent dehydrogenase (Short-subunit alcohol dehydrogenase family) n=1 Tax=Inhella inkyongensis TaxID=392593 RepID=A0A840S466_9BURK|nr:SDR family NAD(P)-dependent oxidoreductase [Inhella inkyongensis]MBB5203604.1 NAD(P)-dependent dehydrogenase (short-subunit alcohol dehydrogenase family) [Inhella inkyongensis]
MKRVLITGAGQGIGAAIARRLQRDGGVELVLVGRRLAPLQALADELGAQAQACDVTDAAAVQALFEAVGPVDILINNAGQAESAPLTRTSDALWRQMLDVNLTGSFLCLRAALPAMQAAGWGRIVNVASTAAQRGYAYVAAYCAAKHGLLGLTRAAALELAKTGITVNAVCPGYTETELLAASIANVMAKTGRSEEQARADFARSNPQGRLIQPEEVAETVAWLCSEGAASITGQAISISGGEVMA